MENLLLNSIRTQLADKGIDLTAQASAERELIVGRTVMEEINPHFLQLLLPNATFEQLSQKSKDLHITEGGNIQKQAFISLLLVIFGYRELLHKKMDRLEEAKILATGAGQVVSMYDRLSQLNLSGNPAHAMAVNHIRLNLSKNVNELADTLESFTAEVEQVYDKFYLSIGSLIQYVANIRLSQLEIEENLATFRQLYADSPEA